MLKYEWRFYFALLPASIFARRKVHLPASLILLASTIVASHYGKSDSWQYWVLFAIGMVTASLRNAGLLPRLPNVLASTLVVGGLVAVFVRHPAAYGTEQALVLGIVFLLICGGASVYGVLTTNGAIRLGHASYGIYLLQGFVFSLGFDNPIVRPRVTADISGFWMATIAGMLVLSAIAACLYAALERPMIVFGRKVGSQASSSIALRVQRTNEKTPYNAEN